MSDENDKGPIRPITRRSRSLTGRRQGPAAAASAKAVPAAASRPSPGPLVPALKRAAATPAQRAVASGTPPVGPATPEPLERRISRLVDERLGGEALAGLVAELVDVRLSARVGEALKKAEASSLGRLSALVEQRLEGALEPHMKRIEARALAVRGNVSPTSLEDSAIEARVSDLAGSIESAAAGRAIDAVLPRIDEVVSEKLRALESRLSSKLAAVAEGSSRRGAGPEQVPLDARLEALVAEKVQGLEARLSKLVETKTLLVSERLDELLSRKVELLVAKQAKATTQRLVAPAPQPVDMEALAAKLSELLPGVLLPKLTDQVSTLVTEETGRFLTTQLAGAVACELERQLPRSLPAHLPDPATLLPAARVKPDAEELGRLEQEVTERFEKRVLTLVDQRLSEVTSGTVSPAGTTPSAAASGEGLGEIALAVATSNELKQALDKRFRAMLNHFEGEVLPRLVRDRRPGDEDERVEGTG